MRSARPCSTPCVRVLPSPRCWNAAADAQCVVSSRQRQSLSSPQQDVSPSDVPVSHLLFDSQFRIWIWWFFMNWRTEKRTRSRWNWDWEPRSALLANAPEPDLVLVVLRNGSVGGSAAPDHHDYFIQKLYLNRQKWSNQETSLHQTWRPTNKEDDPDHQIIRHWSDEVASSSSAARLNRRPGMWAGFCVVQQFFQFRLRLVLMNPRFWRISEGCHFLNWGSGSGFLPRPFRTLVPFILIGQIIRD